MRHWKPGVLAVAALVATAAPARADWTVNPACGGTTFATCASVSLATGSNSTGTWIQITVQNLGANGMAGYYDSIFTTVGLVNLPSGTFPTSIADGSGGGGTGGDNWSQWSPPPPQDLNGLPAYTYGMRAPSSPVDNGLQVGQSIMFKFQFTGLIDSAELAQIGVGIHGQSGPVTCSTKLAVINGQVTTTGPYDASCVSTVPEPGTFVLLGTGLLGLALVVRRRRKLDIEHQSAA